MSPRSTCCKPGYIRGPVRWRRALCCMGGGALALNVAAWASGPVSPELGSFAPLEQADLVEPFTGQFHYNVPLMEVPGPSGGYPIALTYASGVTPDEDASWVGLGWTLSPGAIVRQMRGVPDDFNADEDQITTVLDIEPQRTYGLGIAGNYEFFGLDTSVGTGISFGLTGYFDNYRGFGINNTVGLSAQTKSEGMSASVGLSISEDNLEGDSVGATSSLSLNDTARFGADLSYDTGRGLPSLSFSVQASYQNSQFLALKTGNVFDFLGYAKPASLPGTGRETQGSNIKVSFKAGGEVYGNYIDGTLSGFYNWENLRTHIKTTPAVGYLHLEEAIRSADLKDPHRVAADDDLTRTFALDFNREKDGPIYEQSPNLALPVVTNDLFVVSGRDLTGTFRAYRNDTVAVFDPKQESDITGGAVGVDVGFGELVKVGVTGSLNHSSTTIGRWDGGGVAPAGQPNNVDTLLGAVKRAFQPDPGGYLERAYFKFIGEPSVAPAPESADWQPVAPKLTGTFVGDSVQAALASNGVIPPFYYAAGTVDGQNQPVLAPPPGQRVPRANLIQAFSNGELRSLANALPEFRGASTAVDGNSAARAVRDSHPNHIGGFRITDKNGTRYVYGAAVYNTAYEEHKFSVDRTALCPASGYCTIIKPPAATGDDETNLGAAYDYRVKGSEQFLEIKKLSPYPTSYLLTAIVGPDYVDSDGVPGPSDGDAGYWVKFNYVLGSADFKWRTPYVGAGFVRGPDNGRFIVGTERLGDKGYFSYGSRETWYLASIETATHKAFMCVDRMGRRDAIGAVVAGQNDTPTTGFDRPWKLTSVRLYAKAALVGHSIDPTTNCPDGTPLMEAHLDYEAYDTQAQRQNNLSLANLTPDAPVGKLTLKRVYFTHLGSQRGQLSPYLFDYGGGDAARNPDYHDGQRDRWGSFQVPPPPPGAQAGAAPAAMPAVEDRMAWTDQTSQGHTDLSSPNALDQSAGTWSLRKVTEPTGRTVAVQYEAGDYAYVQGAPATRFFPLTSVNAGVASATSQLDTVCPAVVGSSGATAISATLLATTFPTGPPPGLPSVLDCALSGTAATPPRIYFRLECDDQGANCDTNVNDYVDVGGDSQVYFKVRMALKRDNAGPAKWQTISGYANVHDAGVAGNGIGWLELAPVHTNYPTGLDYHPLAHAAWQYLRLQQPELSHDGGINGDPDGDPVKEAVNVLTLVDTLPEIVQSLTGLYPGWLLRGWGQSVDLNNAWVRLKDPDGIKKGGAARVRQITLSDRWNASTGGRESDLVTGYVYSYRLEDGRSSGVAAYEPVEGGDENALRQAKSFTDQVMLSSDYNLFAELPVGESHYPAASVGYSRVLRRSLAAQADISHAASRSHPTSAGPTVYEFYTARDFPVRSAETPVSKQRLPFPQVIDIPLLGSISVSSLTASQGYLTTINDMHGKPKRVASYQYTDHFDPQLDDYVVREDPIEETLYQYHSSGGTAGAASQLENSQLPTLEADPGPNPGPTVGAVPATLAQQSDFVVDLRQNRTESFDGGINLNVDTFLIVYVPVPIPVPMPNFGYSLTETKTVVTSRVVHQSGILEGVTVREGTSRVTTSTDLSDPVTGAAVLSEADNAFGKPVFSYDMPARWSTPRAGPAYQDVGRFIDLSGGTFDASGDRLTLPANVLVACPDLQPTPGAQPPTAQRCLPVGTELASPSGNGGSHLTLLKSDTTSGTTVFGVDGDVGAGAPRTAVVVRSGNRNLLTLTSDTIRALDNPLLGRTVMRCPGSGAIDVAHLPTVSDQTLVHSVLDARHVSYSDYWPNLTTQTSGADVQNGDYRQGLRGIFRPSVHYVYRAERGQSRPVDLTRDGAFDAALFGPGAAPQTCARPWLPVLTHTEYSPGGFDIEDFNALDIYSTAQFGSGGTLPFATATNAMHEEIGFEGFETDALSSTANGQVRSGEGNIAFEETTRCVLSGPFGCANRQPVASITTAHAHTGKRSLRIDADQGFDQPRLHLKSAKRYLISAWVSLGSVGTNAADVPTYAPAPGSGRTLGLQVSYHPTAGASQVLASFTPDGPVIDGWQRIEGVFQTPTLPAGATAVGGFTIAFLNSVPAAGVRVRPTNVPQPAYFDDLRIQPEDASLVGFVYDPDTRRMTAALDENNFATFYRYAPDGRLDLVRRETVRGVLSEQEARLHIQERP